LFNHSLNRFAMNKLLTRSTLVISLLTLAHPASAETFRDGLDVYVTGLSADSQFEVTYPAIQKSKDIKADACGFLVIRNSTTNPVTGTITVAGTSVDTTTLPTNLLPRCTNGTPEQARSTNFKTPTGDIVIVGNAASSFKSVTLPQSQVRRTRANACGYVRLASSNSYQHTNTMALTLNGTATTIGNLTQKDAPICRGNVMYVPQSWLGFLGS
jgi:hypothetical protein